MAFSLASNFQAIGKMVTDHSRCCKLKMRQPLGHQQLLLMPPHIIPLPIALLAPHVSCIVTI
jgi:hypothetical protein